MTRSLTAVVLAVMCMAAALAAGPAADLSGTWIGPTQVPDSGEDKIKLELKAEAGSYTGIASDSLGLVIPSPITNVKVDGATLTFDISVNNGQSTFPVHILLKVDGDTLTGSWATDNGDSAPMTLTRQK